MDKITITIRTGNAAFYNDNEDGHAPGPELARILRGLADKLDQEPLECDYPERLMDRNGNAVGTVETN